MSSAALLDQDFGSESEDDNFNPAPAEESDNDAAEDPEDDVNVKSNGDHSRRRPSAQHASDEDGHEDEEIPQRSAAGSVNGRQSNRHGSLGPKSEDGENIKQDQDPGTGGGVDDEDEEDEEEDEDDDAISVRLCPVDVVQPFLK